MGQDAGETIEIEALFYLVKVKTFAVLPIFRSKSWQELKRRPELHLG